MKKVVINACYGGFGLSADALYLLMRLGFPLEATPLKDSGYDEADFPLVGPDGVRAASRSGRPLLKDGVLYSAELSPYDPQAMALRSHPALVKTVEMLGERANGFCAKLVIEDVPDDALFRIEEYDGSESVRLLSTEDYTAGFTYVEPALPPDMQLGWTAPLLAIAVN